MGNKKFGKIFFVLGFVLLVAGVIASISFSYAESDNPGSSSITIQSDGYPDTAGSYQVKKTAKWVGEGEAEITLDFKGISKQQASPNLDLVLVIDTTYSMLSDKKIDEAKAAASELIGSLLSDNSPNNRVALITFNSLCISGNCKNVKDDSYIVSGFVGKSNASDLKDKVNKIKIKSATTATYYEYGLNQISELLKDYRDKDNTDLMVLFLTDGKAYDTEAKLERMFKNLTNDHTKLNIIGISYNSSTTNYTALKYCTHSQYSATPSNLLSVYENAVQRNLNYSDITIDDTISDDFSLIQDTVKTSNGTVDINSSEISWNMKDVTTGNLDSLTFRVKLKDEEMKKSPEGNILSTNDVTNVSVKIENETSYVTKSTTDSPKLQDGYKVTYDMNYPEATTENKIEEYHRAYSSVGLKDKLPNYNGYVFKEWICSDPNVSILNDGFKMPTNDVTFTAVWEKVEVDKKIRVYESDDTYADYTELSDFGLDVNKENYASSSFFYVFNVKSSVWNEKKQFGGTIDNVEITDKLPDGLIYVDDEKNNVNYDSAERTIYFPNSTTLFNGNVITYMVKVKTPDQISKGSSEIFNNVVDCKFNGNLCVTNSTNVCAGFCSYHKVKYLGVNKTNNCSNNVYNYIDFTSQTLFVKDGTAITIAKPNTMGEHADMISTFFTYIDDSLTYKDSYTVTKDIEISFEAICHTVYPISFSFVGDVPPDFVVPPTKYFYGTNGKFILSFEKGDTFNDYVFDGWKKLITTDKRDYQIKYEYNILSNGELGLTSDTSCGGQKDCTMINGKQILLPNALTINYGTAPYELVGSFTRKKYNVDYILTGDLPNINDINSNGYNFAVNENGQYVYSKEYYYGDSVTLPNFDEIEGYYFDGWDSEDFIMPMENRNVIGEFKRSSYSIDINYCLYGNNECQSIYDSETLTGLYGDPYTITPKTIPGYILVTDSDYYPSSDILTGQYGPSLTGVSVNFYYKLASDGAVSVSKIIKDGDIYKYHGTPVFIFKLIGTDILGNDHTYYRTVVFDEGYEHYQYSPLGYEEFIKTVSFDDLPYGTYTLSMIGVNRYKTGSLYDNINGLNPSLTKQFDINSDRTSYTYYSLATKKDATRLSHNAYYTTTAV